MKRFTCFFKGHVVNSYATLKRVSPDKVLWKCARCGKVLEASDGLSIQATIDFGFKP
ncbi:MAG: hypothetical protein IPN23_10615 [Elusimicrobia bacterium]|nr:hypothetical protein [Elusimicrobiota bacterium]